MCARRKILIIFCFTALVLLFGVTMGTAQLDKEPTPIKPNSNALIRTDNLTNEELRAALFNAGVPQNQIDSLLQTREQPQAVLSYHISSPMTCGTGWAALAFFSTSNGNISSALAYTGLYSGSDQVTDYCYDFDGKCEWTHVARRNYVNYYQHDAWGWDATYIFPGAICIP